MNLRTAVTLLPTPKATDGTKGGPNQRGSAGDLTLPSTLVRLGTDCQPGGKIDLLPTPSARDEKGRSTPAGTVRADGRVRTVADFNLPMTVTELLSTPSVTNANQPTPEPVNWAWSGGDFTPAIRRWERVLGREAPNPTEPGRRGQPRISSTFVEWMMGLMPGFVVDVDGVSRGAALRILGNAVVQQQAYAAICSLMDYLINKEEK